MMKIEYDKDVDAAYIYIEFPIKEGDAVNTVKINDNIIVDFNKQGKLLGVEVLDARKFLSKNVLQHAQIK
ncbi:DUF2283 domain-containing protein [Candidatus Woesearchaeota archaeon]|nr:DUF2283 domain-containing protein [Candidatus Woesearchaeota archaeon]